ncbi:IS110 family transposase [soil metagenome]
MNTLPERDGDIIVGVDTHADVHVAAALDAVGRLLATTSVPTTLAGYTQLVTWAGGLGSIRCFGVEGTGVWGAGLARFLAGKGQAVIEVDRPDRRNRRRRGKSDTVDAEAAARAVLSGQAVGQPKAQHGQVEMIRALRVACRSAMKARTSAMNQLHGLVVRASEALRAELRSLSSRQLVERAGALRPGELTTVEAATQMALREVARRHQALSAEITRLQDAIGPLVAATAPNLLALHGVGPETAAILFVTAGDDPERLRSDATFAHLCGVAPVEASSGRTTRHRLNRSGDRQANHALWRIVIVRMKSHQPTRAYVERRTTEGLSKREVIRCLKRYVARDVYRHLVTHHQPPTLAAQAA